MQRQRYVQALPRSSAALVAALLVAGCSGDSEPPAATVAAPPPAPRAEPAAPAAPADRSQAVYDAYFRHCKEFTWRALVYPQTARNETEAARRYAGPPRPHQRAAFRGCLAGLRSGEATITLDEIRRLHEEEEAEHGG